MAANSTLQFRNLMSRFPTGVTVIAVAGHPDADSVVGMTANAVSAVSLDPLLLLCCIRNQSAMLQLLRTGKRFSLNILASDQDAISRYYGGQPDRGQRGAWDLAGGDVPVLSGANASFICEVSACQQAGDHTVVFGDVLRMVSMDPPAPALVYASGKYSRLELAH